MTSEARQAGELKRIVELQKQFTQAFIDNNAIKREANGEHRGNAVTLAWLAAKSANATIARLERAYLSELADYAKEVGWLRTLKPALEQICKGEGEFSRDPLEHATNTIENMKAIAAATLAGEGKP